MAKLGTYFGTHDGDMKLYVGMFQVGSGRFNAFSDFQSEFAGTYSAFGQAGQFTIDVRLTDSSATNTSGPCTIVLNGATDAAARYQVNGQKLTIATTLNNAPIDIYVKQGGTQVDDISGHNLWIGQWG